MKLKKLPSRLAPLALCAIIVVLIVKLVISAGNMIAGAPAGIVALSEKPAEEKKEQSGTAMSRLFRKLRPSPACERTWA